MTQLDALKSHSLVVADTGDLGAIRRYRPQDATTNPSLILKAFDLAEHQDLIAKTLAQAKSQVREPAARVEQAADRLCVAIGSEIARLVPGRVSTEVAARLSFDTDASIRKAQELIGLYDQRGIGPERVLIKLASTWEGIRAAEQLERDGIQCNLTLLFSEAQARACFDAGVHLISPFVGRVTDWYKANTGKDYGPEDDPGALFVRHVCQIASTYAYETAVMGASFRTTGQILALAGCNRLTVSPQLLEALASREGAVEKRISPSSETRKPPPPLTEAQFRWGHNQDAMANEKLADGIRRFAADQEELEGQIAERMGQELSWKD